jgi:hypothetical protein
MRFSVHTTVAFEKETALQRSFSVHTGGTFKALSEKPSDDFVQI